MPSSTSSKIWPPSTSTSSTAARRSVSPATSFAPSKPSPSPACLDAAKSVLHTLLHLEKSVLIQEYIAASHGMDVRVFVVNGRVIGSMQRTATNGEFRSNLHLGGRGSRYSLTPEMREISIAAAHTFDLHIAGVDLLLSDDGPLITEVNPSPGLEGIESITGLDIARSIVRAAENLTREHQIARASH